jgi:SAM-dependent MidA family methyltransferase
VTAPELTPLFATALATQIAAILAATPRREIVELGGAAAGGVDLLNALGTARAVVAT